jgi:hypothetical protein
LLHDASRDRTYDIGDKPSGRKNEIEDTEAKSIGYRKAYLDDFLS